MIIVHTRKPVGGHKDKTMSNRNKITKKFATIMFNRQQLNDE